MGKNRRGNFQSKSVAKPPPKGGSMFGKQLVALEKPVDTDAIGDDDSEVILEELNDDENDEFTLVEKMESADVDEDKDDCVSLFGGSDLGGDAPPVGGGDDSSNNKQHDVGVFSNGDAIPVSSVIEDVTTGPNKPVDLRKVIDAKHNSRGSGSFKNRDGGGRKVGSSADGSLLGKAPSIMPSPAVFFKQQQQQLAAQRRTSNTKTPQSSGSLLGSMPVVGVGSGCNSLLDISDSIGLNLNNSDNMKKRKVSRWSNKNESPRSISPPVKRPTQTKTLFDRSPLVSTAPKVKTLLGSAPPLMEQVSYPVAQNFPKPVKTLLGNAPPVMEPIPVASSVPSVPKPVKTLLGAPPPISEQPPSQHFSAFSLASSNEPKPVKTLLGAPPPLQEQQQQPFLSMNAPTAPSMSVPSSGPSPIKTLLGNPPSAMNTLSTESYSMNLVPALTSDSLSSSAVADSDSLPSSVPLSNTLPVVMDDTTPQAVGYSNQLLPPISKQSQPLLQFPLAAAVSMDTKITPQQLHPVPASMGQLPLPVEQPPMLSQQQYVAPYSSATSIASASDYLPSNISIGAYMPQLQSANQAMSSTTNSVISPVNIANKSEKELRDEVTEAFKTKNFNYGYHLLTEASRIYPHAFHDAVFNEVVEFTATNEEFEICVKTARLIRQPDLKLLEYLANLAEKYSQQMKPVTDELWLIFHQVLSIQPEPNIMMAFIKCFSALKSWTKVWNAVERYAQMQIIPIEGFIICIEALANGQSSEFRNLGISMLANMGQQNIHQVGPELISKLWIRCAMEGNTDNVTQLERIRSVFPSQHAYNRTVVAEVNKRITELTMESKFDDLCTLFVGLYSRSDICMDALINALIVAEDPFIKFEHLMKVVSEKARTRTDNIFQILACQIAVKLLKRCADRQQWKEAMQLLKVTQAQSLFLGKAVAANLPEITESFIANTVFLILMRNHNYSLASSMLNPHGSPLGITLPVSGEQSSTRQQLLHELYNACVTEGQMLEAGAALKSLMRHPVTAGSGTDLNRTYNEFLAACCERSQTADELKNGLDIISLAHQCQLVISATVLRQLLVCCFKFSLKSDAKNFLDLGTQVGIYPIVNISTQLGPKTVQLKSDMSKEEVHVVLVSMMIKLKKYLMEALANREMDVIEECTIRLTAVNVGDRDRGFTELFRVQNTEQAVLQRAAEVLNTPKNFHTTINTKLFSENGVTVLSLDGTTVYQCVYYIDEDAC